MNFLKHTIETLDGKQTSPLIPDDQARLFLVPSAQPSTLLSRRDPSASGRRPNPSKHNLSNQPTIRSAATCTQHTLTKRAPTRGSTDQTKASTDQTEVQTRIPPGTHITTSIHITRACSSALPEGLTDSNVAR